METKKAVLTAMSIAGTNTKSTAHPAGKLLPGILNRSGYEKELFTWQHLQLFSKGRPYTLLKIPFRKRHVCERGAKIILLEDSTT
jgi:hypothetical protein